MQSDVRKFLLDAPFELTDDDVVEVKLEVATAGGRRIDVEAGCAVIEVKKSLGSSSVFDAAVGQLTGYVGERTEAAGQRFVGILTDGQLWVLFHLEPSGTLGEVDRFRLRSSDDGLALAAWLEPVLATRGRVSPTPKEIVRRLGAGSAAAELDLADLRALYDACRSDPEVQLKRELWARLLLVALGTNFEDSDDLFVTHTYLVLVAELVAHEVMRLPVAVRAEDVRGLLEGQQFAMAGLHGVVEADFFDWPVAVDAGGPVVAGIARRLSRFDWSDVEHDVLKALYESVIDSETRRKLGEYYTPDWLAEKMVSEQFSQPLEQRLLDPACGSGTFLFWAIRRLLHACDEAGIPNRQALERVVEQVQGLDLHPVAVTLARVTYLLAVTPDRLTDRGELTVPVFLGDSVRWGHDDITFTADGMKVSTSEELELIEDDLHFPEGVVEEPTRFDRLLSDLADRAAKRKRGTKPSPIRGLLNRHRVTGDADREAIQAVFNKLCRLHDKRRDHVWSYYIRNRARPLSYTRPDHRVDTLVGNPPWLAYRAMPTKLQETYRQLAAERGLWVGGKVATHQDLSDLFVVRSVEQYLKTGGHFAFVMPYGVLSRRQFAGFRTGAWSGGGFETSVRLLRADEFSRVKPPLFPMPACVIAGSKAAGAQALPAGATSWTGRVSARDIDWETAQTQLRRHEKELITAHDGLSSPYRALFTQGATLVPRVLLMVERRAASAIGMPAGMIPITSARSTLEKQPWKSLDSLVGVVEEQFLHPMHAGSTVVAYRERAPHLVVVPWHDGELLHAEHERLDEFPGLAAWWREAEQIWETHKSSGSRLSLVGQVDFQGKLRKQLPIAPHRVVYTASGQHLAAARLEDPEAVVEHKLYWAPVGSVDEGRYLCAVLNSQVLAETVLLLQSRGQHNPRDFDMHVFALGFPAFDAGDELHAQLVSLAARAEDVAAAVRLDDGWQFQKARRVTREALREDGVAADIDVAVGELVSRAALAPDLMGALAAAQEKLRRKRKTEPVSPVTPAKARITVS